MKRKKQKKQIKIIHLLVLLMVMIFILFVVATYRVFQDNNLEPENNVDSNTDVVIDLEKIENSADEEELNKIKGMTERDRIEYYIANFIRNLEEKNYEEAYSLLNKDFKKNYFPTIKDFIEYCQNKFTLMLDVEYTNFERNGQIYISWITLTDAINGDKNSGVEMNFVVKENDFNDFELSFSIK